MILLLSFIQTWFMQGLLHPLLSPSHLILLVSLGVLIGQQGIKTSYFLALIGSAIAGVVLNQQLTVNYDRNFELILLSLALIISLIVVIKQRIPFFMMLLLIIIAGVAVAFDSDPVVIPGVADNSVNNWLFGAVTTIATSVFLWSIIATLLKRFWDGIILRILGSWIATSAIFIITLSFTPLTKGLG